MSLLFIDGFDKYSGYSAPNGWMATYACVYPSDKTLVAGRFGGIALYITSVGGIENVNRALGSLYASFTHGAAIYVPSLSSEVPIFEELQGSNYQVTLSVGTSGQIKVYRGSRTGTLLGSSANGVIAVNTWYYLELSCTVNPSAGVVSVNVNGVNVLSLTGLNTYNAGTTGIDTIGMCEAGSGISVTFDDTYFKTDLTPLGPLRIETLIPVADISGNVWVPDVGSLGYSRVNTGQADGDTSYIQGTNVGDLDLFGLSGIAESPSSIFGVQVTLQARSTDGLSTRAVAPVLNANGATNVGAGHTIAAAYSFPWQMWNQNPTTAAAWTASDFNSLQAGVKVTA